VLPLDSLVKDNPALCKQLHRFSRARATQLIAALGVPPQYHANTIRLEDLTHLAVIACSGTAEPNRSDLAKWLRYFDEESWISRQEDPVEDVFIGMVNSSFGCFRLFSGIFADGCFIVKRLIHFLAKAASLPDQAAHFAKYASVTPSAPPSRQPTLWRAYRVSANRKRLQILALLSRQPNQTVSTVARLGLFRRDQYKLRLSSNQGLTKRHTLRSMHQ
jgi:hypothetical protein